MQRRLPPLRSLVAFEAVARTGSVALAAEALNLTASAVSHRLKRLEEHLGRPLFNRTNRRLVLTDRGREYLQYVESAFDRIERSSEQFLRGQGKDILTIHCPPSFAPAWLLPRLGEFKANFPNIEVRIHATPQPVDFFKTDTDVEIRYGNADWSGLTVHLLDVDTISPLASPGIAASLGAESPHDFLSRQQLIVSERSNLTWNAWCKVHDIPILRGRGLRFDRGSLACQAASLELGVTLESRMFAQPFLKSGVLTPIWPDGRYDVQAGHHTLVYPPAFGDVPKIRAFVDWALGQVA